MSESNKLVCKQNKWKKENLVRDQARWGTSTIILDVVEYVGNDFKGSRFHCSAFFLCVLLAENTLQQDVVKIVNFK